MTPRNTKYVLHLVCSNLCENSVIPQKLTQAFNPNLGVTNGCTKFSFVIVFWSFQPAQTITMAQIAAYPVPVKMEVVVTQFPVSVHVGWDIRERTALNRVRWANMGQTASTAVTVKTRLRVIG